MKYAVIILSVLFLSACGGGGGGGGATITPSSTTSTPTPTSKYVNVDFATKVNETAPDLSTFDEFVQLCNQ